MLDIQILDFYFDSMSATPILKAKCGDCYYYIKEYFGEYQAIFYDTVSNDKEMLFKGSLQQCMQTCQIDAWRYR